MAETRLFKTLHWLPTYLNNLPTEYIVNTTTIPILPHPTRPRSSGPALTVLLFSPREQLSLFDENSASHDEKDSHTRESSSKSHALRAATTLETPVTNNRGKTLEEMKITIRKILNEDLRKVQEVWKKIFRSKQPHKTAWKSNLSMYSFAHIPKTLLGWV